jgi:hypothetical protein
MADHRVGFSWQWLTADSRRLKAINQLGEGKGSVALSLVP